MEGDGIANLSGKIISAEGNFSTLDSMQATIKEPSGKQSKTGGDENHSSDRSQEIERQNAAHDFERAKLQCQNRLFTFMDERDCEKVFIQNYFLRTIHQLPSENKENQSFHLNQVSSHPSKKLEYFLQINRQSIQKLAVKKSLSKLSKSNNNKISAEKPAKTSKISNFFENTKTSVSPRQHQRSLKTRNNRSITPKYIKENKMLGDCSHLVGRNSSVKIINKWRKKQLVGDQQHRQMEQKQYINIKKQEPVNFLLKKKKELQKQLTAINDSLASLKRKNDVRNKLEDIAKSKRKQQGAKARKSFTRLSKKF